MRHTVSKHEKEATKIMEVDKKRCNTVAKHTRFNTEQERLKSGQLKEGG